MRAFVVEFGGSDDRDTVLGQVRELSPGEADPAARGEGALADRAGPRPTTIGRPVNPPSVRSARGPSRRGPRVSRPGPPRAG